MKIKTVSVIGLGALGIMYSHFFTQKLESNRIHVLADKDRIQRYQTEGIYINDERCHFNYVDNDRQRRVVDLVIFAVKSTQLTQVIEQYRDQINENTIILSVLNGVSSEKVLADVFGIDNVLLCTAQGMDATKEGNHLYCKGTGFLRVGTHDGIKSPQLERVMQFFDEIDFAYEYCEDMIFQLWNKLVLNVGINQSCAVFDLPYSGVQCDGNPRDTMIAAMQETIIVGRAEGVQLPDTIIQSWLKITDSLSADGMPSMRQDVLAHRKTEVDLFSGTVIALGKKHKIPTPINDWLYKRIIEIEDKY